MKIFLLFCVSCILVGCSWTDTSQSINYLSSLNPATRTLSLSGKNIGTISALHESIPNQNDQLMVNHFIASDGGIVSVDPNAFMFFKNLTVLDLSDNNLTEFALAPANSLVDINLSSNNLTVVDLSELPFGHNIDLSQNELDDFSTIKLPRDVLTLNLAGNNLSDISALSQYKLLRILDLSNNPLGSEDLESLKNIPRLVQIKLAGSVSPEEEKKLQEWLDLRAAGKL